MNSAQATENFENSPGIMYKLGSIEAQLRSINEKLDTIERSQDIEIANLKKDVEELKRRDAIKLGAAAAVSFIIGILVQVVPWQNLF